METLTTVEVHGKKHTVREELGDGLYTKAYRLKSGRVLCVSEDDVSKKVLLQAQKAKNPHIPKMSLVSTSSSIDVYRMSLYKTAFDCEYENIDTKATKQIQTIRAFYFKWANGYCIRGKGLDKAFDFCDALSKANIVPVSIIEAMLIILNIAKENGYLGTCCDFHAGNWATTPNGRTLILLDVFNVKL